MKPIDPAAARIAELLGCDGRIAAQVLGRVLEDPGFRRLVRRAWADHRLDTRSAGRPDPLWEVRWAPAPAEEGGRR